MTTEKTPFRKNLDKRYISGEDLKNGIEMGKGLRPEMVVTLVKFADAPAFDQATQKEVDKTALWLKEYPSGQTLYKPCLLNVERASFMSKELAGGSLFIDDCDNTKPFVIWAKPDRRHGYVVAFKKFYPPAIDDKNALATIKASTTLTELQANWKKLTPQEQALPTVLSAKDQLKTQLK